MSKIRFAPWVALACIGTLAGCTSGEGGTVGNTELNVIVPNNGSQSPNPNGDPQPPFIDIGTVEYTIACNDAIDNGPFLDNGASEDDDVTINGNLEVVDGRTDTQGPIPPEFGTPRPGDRSEIWQGFMDLPPGDCTVQLRARDGDGEVICTSTEMVTIAANALVKVNIVMICDISFQAPVGMLDVDGTFSFNVGNFCPNLFVLNCVESNPVAPIPGLPPTTYCETRWEDLDSTCGTNCDPQTCVPTPDGLTCTPGPDPGVSTTVMCDQILDCEGDFIPDTSCTWAGDYTGMLGAGIPVPVIQGGPGPLPGGFYTGCAVDGLGNPLTPGLAISCTAVTTDGDVDCDKTKVVSYNCPGLAACDPGATPPPPDCTTDPAITCTVGSCDDSSGSAVCVETNVPGGGGPNCTSNPGAPISLGECDGNGNCLDFGCVNQADCDAAETDPCFVAGACDTATGICAPSSPGNDGATCNTGTGSGDGSCLGGTCVSNDVCDPANVPPECGDGNDCTIDTCSGTPLVCSWPFEPNGTPCDAGGGPGSGACDGVGNCAAPPVVGVCSDVQNSRALPKTCTSGDFDATAFIYTCNVPASPPIDVPGGGTANAFSDPVSPYAGCEVPSSALAGQLAVDTFIDMDVFSSGDGNVTTNYNVIAVNAALGIAAAIAELVDLNVNTDITTAVPSTVTNSLNPAFYNTPVGAYVTGGNTFTLTGGVHIDVNTEPVVPTSSPNVAIGFRGNFLLELFLITALQPLNIDGASCSFDLLGADLTCPVI